MSARWPDSGGGGGGILVEEDPEATPRLDALEPKTVKYKSGGVFADKPLKVKVAGAFV